MNVQFYIYYYKYVYRPYCRTVCPCIQLLSVSFTVAAIYLLYIYTCVWDFCCCSCCFGAVFYFIFFSFSFVCSAHLYIHHHQFVWIYIFMLFLWMCICCLKERSKKKKNKNKNKIHDDLRPTDIIPNFLPLVYWITSPASYIYGKRREKHLWFVCCVFFIFLHWACALYIYWRSVILLFI